MKKEIIIISSVVAVLLSGCFGGGGKLTVPVKERAQDVDAKVMPNIKVNAHKEFTSSLENAKYSNIKTASLGQLKTSNEELYNLILPIAEEAQKMYKERALPQDILTNGAEWLNGDITNLNVTTATTSGKFNGRFSPYSDLLILNFEKRENDNSAKFLIAHEFAHALALHSSEDRTKMQQILDGSEDLTNLSQDILLNEAYVQLDSTISKNMDIVVDEFVYNNLFNEKDLADEQKIINARKNGFVAQAAIASGQKDQLSRLGIDLAIPLKTKMVLKYLINSGLDVSGALDVLKGGVDFASANAIMISAHPKEQELEADSISLALNKRLGNDTQESACEIFAKEKAAGIFDAHPSYSDRRANLGCAQ